MAFGGKKDRDAAPSVQLEAVPIGAEAVEDTDEDQLASTDEAPAPDPAAAPEAPDTDSLLSMFQSNESLTEDRSALLGFVKEVELDDLLEELQTVALALGIVAASADAAAPASPTLAVAA
jgi:hypothetical protein